MAIIIVQTYLSDMFTEINVCPLERDACIEVCRSHDVVSINLKISKKHSQGRSKILVAILKL